MRRHHPLLPRFREKWFYTARASQWVLWHWRAREGYVIRALGTGAVPGLGALFERPVGDDGMGFTKRVAAGERLPQPQLPNESKILGKLLQLVAFVSDVAYDDKSMRTPGYFTVRNRVFTYEITLYDPDAGMRVAIRDTSLDAMFAAANALLLAPDAPWEQDDYLMAQLVKKNPKKK